MCHKEEEEEVLGETVRKLDGDQLVVLNVEGRAADAAKGSEAASYGGRARFRVVAVGSRV